MKTPQNKKSWSVKRVAPISRKKRPKHRFILRLFVAGASTRSHQAILHVRELCKAIMQDDAKLEVIDIYQQPALARANQIVATPTLILVLPLPARRFIGSLSNVTDLFGLLDLGEKGQLIL
jgi:circadian clock protein KaiB